MDNAQPDAPFGSKLKWLQVGGALLAVAGVLVSSELFFVGVMMFLLTMAVRVGIWTWRASADAFECVQIFALCIAAAILYGICHDQITARVCVDYFTIGHPPVFETESPTLLALGWGVIATWWVGAMLAVPATAASRLGSRPKFSAGKLFKPVGLLLGVMAAASLAAGVTGYFAAKAGGVQLVGPLASRVPVEKHQAFIADLWAHLAAYGVGFVGGIVLCGWIWRRRRAMGTATATDLPGTG